MTSLTLTSCQLDDSDIWDKLDEYGESIRNHEQRISALEELCKQMNTNIEALQTLVNALEKRDCITNVSEVRSNGKVIGYTISFAYSDTITIYHDKDGNAPQIGVMKDSDGIYYWTIDGEWMLDARGGKIQAVGTDGITPQLKIENGYWHISYDNGTTWTQLAESANGAIIKVEELETEVIFTLADGSTITLPKGDKAEIDAENNKIYYTTTDGKKIFPYSTEPSVYGAMFISNTYKDGQGILTFDDTITSIGDWAFAMCNTLESITIPDSVTKIGFGAFDECPSLANITIPNNVTTIGNEAFYGCTSLTSVTIPDSVTKIESYAFYGCTSLTDITIGKGVTWIGSCALYECYLLRNIYCKPTIPPTIEDEMFFISTYNDSEYVIFVPKGSLDSYKAAWSDVQDYIIEEGSTIVENDKTEAAYITIDEDIFAVPLNGKEIEVKIKTNGKWQAHCSESDVTIIPNSGYLTDGVVKIIVPETTYERAFDIIFEVTKSTFDIDNTSSYQTYAQAGVTIIQNVVGVDMSNTLFSECCGSSVEKINSNWPYVSEFNGWDNAGNVTYTGKMASVRDSGSYYQADWDSAITFISGAPYVFINKKPLSADFVIENLAVTGGANYTFTYNVSCQEGYSNGPLFAPVDNSLVHLELGYDGKSWDRVGCTFVRNGNNGWYIASAQFKVAANATKLYARLSYEAPVENGGCRLDDFMLLEGGNGRELAPEASVITETSIADINTAGNYKVANAWAVAAHAHGCLLTDTSGAYILAYNPSENPAVGEVVNIEGTVSDYGGLLQFGAGATVTKTGTTKSVTHPAAEVLDGAKVDALVKAIEVKYVEYEGTLSINNGKYYNITIADTTNQGSIQYPTEDMKATLTTLDGKSVKVTGYTIGVSSGKYLNTIATSVEIAAQ